MKFKYIASQPDGKIIEGEVDADSQTDVLSFLTSRNLRPVSIKSAEASAVRKMSFFGSKINLTDQIFLSKNLALMLRIGVGLLQAINILIDDFEKKAMKALLLEIRAGLEKGQSFYSTFARYPKTFSQTYINLVKVGEASGNLQNIFENLSSALIKEKTLKDQIKGVLVYPIILLATSVLILVFLVAFAIPKIAKLFLESGFDPPLFSKIVFGVGLFFSKYGLFVLGGVVVAAFLLIYAYRMSFTFKKFLLSFVNELPVVKKVVKKVALQRFASTLSSLIKAGMPLTEALEITADTIGNIEIKSALQRISKEGLAKGLTVGEAFRREPAFPRMIVDLIAVSEKAGHIEEVLGTLSEFYVGEIDSSLKTLVSFLEPVLLLSIGVIIGTIALAIIIPIYQLTTQF